MQRINNWKITSVLLAAALYAIAPNAGAQESAAPDRGPEIVRDAVELTRELRPRPVDDVDVADTALVFTNTGLPARVYCAAFNKQGERVGRAWLKIPRLGLRYMLASDLSNDTDFVGHVQCSTGSRVKGSAVFLGPGFSDLPVQQVERGVGRMLFHLVATY